MSNRCFVNVFLFSSCVIVACARDSHPRGIHNGKWDISNGQVANRKWVLCGGWQTVDGMANGNAYFQEGCLCTQVFAQIFNLLWGILSRQGASDPDRVLKIALEIAGSDGAIDIKKFMSWALV